MKKYIKGAVAAVCLSTLSLSLTGCLEEAFPHNSTQTADQIKNADKAALAAAIPAYMTTFDDDYYYDIGFAGFGIWRDAMTADLPVKVITFDYFRYYNQQTYLGDYQLQTTFWRRYYYLLQKANSVISVSNPDSESDAPYLGTALAYRAMVYMDLMRMYEYKETGVTTLDELARSRGIYGLTVPLITEKTTEAESRNLPRTPFYQMYRFIMNDLNNAEEAFAAKASAGSKSMASRGVVYGLKARLWLEMGSRFDNSADDLQAQITNENNPDIADLAKLEISSANDCFANAAIYARKAISEGYTPVSYNEWYNPETGFNTPNNSWMWAIIISPDNSLAKDMVWSSWVSFLSPEAVYGVASSQYKAYRMIDARLFGQITPGDWRIDTWIDPKDVPTDADDDKEDVFKAKYAKASNLTYAEWTQYDAYTGFKYHPGSGNRTTSTIGNAVSIPLMRVEEMYLIEAEAVAHSQGGGAGKQLLESFMNTYRMKAGYTFECASSQLEDVVNDVFTQKRVELWGEGLILWDYRRLRKAIERGYPGTNHLESYRFNSYPEKVAPWTNFYIPDRVNQLNPACILNPDPSGAIPAWHE